MKSHLTRVSTVGMSRDEWLAYRMTGLGASEVGALLGLDDWTSSIELFDLKIGNTTKLDFEGMRAFAGRELEDFVARMWTHWDGSEEGMIRNWRAATPVRKLRRVNAFIRNPAFPWIFVSLDRVANAYDGRGEGTVEVKTIGGFEAAKWDGGLPPKHVTQVQTQMAACELTWGEMPIFQDGHKMEVLPFDASPGIAETIVGLTKLFWDNVLEARKWVNRRFEAERTFNQRLVDECNAAIDSLAPAPDGSLAYSAYLSEKYKRPEGGILFGGAVDLDHALQHARLGEQIRALKEQRTLHENCLKHALGTRQVLDFKGAGKVYWRVGGEDRRYFRNTVKPTA